MKSLVFLIPAISLSMLFGCDKLDQMQTNSRGTSSTESDRTQDDAVAAWEKLVATAKERKSAFEEAKAKAMNRPYPPETLGARHEITFATDDVRQSTSLRAKYEGEIIATTYDFSGKPGDTLKTKHIFKFEFRNGRWVSSSRSFENLEFGKATWTATLTPLGQVKESGPIKPDSVFAILFPTATE